MPKIGPIASPLEAPALSNDVHMSAANENNGGSNGHSDGQGVLANLPRTRPQRSTARRTAARQASASETAAKRSPNGAAEPVPAASARAAESRKAKAQPAAKAKPRAAKRARPAGSSRAGDPVPAQGYESDGDRATRGTVQPPGGAELLGSAAEILGELAKSGLSTGERLVKDVLARLPLN
jgi:hypothetical protein